MVIRLDGADFSDNNLGKIYVGVLDNFTKAAITASGNSSMTDGQKAALNTFFETLGAFGTASNIWSKLDKVYLPLIADDVANAMINYVDNSADTTPSSDYWQLRNRGIVGSFETRTTDRLTYTKNNFFIDMLNVSIFTLATENNTYNGIRSLLNYQGSNGSSRFLIQDSLSSVGKRIMNFTGISPSGNATLLGTYDEGFAKNKALGFSVNTATDVTNITSDGSFMTVAGGAVLNNVVTETNSATYKPLCVANYSADANQRSNNTSTAPYGAIIIGKRLTQAEMTTLKGAMEALANVFNP